MNKRLLIITQAVDKKDQNLSFFCDWIAEFAGQTEKVYVVANRVGEYALPDNVEVFSLGKEDGNGHLARWFLYIKLLFRILPNVQSVFVHMAPEYVVYGGWLARLYGKNLSLWYLHRSKSWKLRLALKMVNNVFTAHKDGVTFRTEKLVVTGHGINTKIFRNHANNEAGLSILTMGRISKSKNILFLVKAILQLASKVDKAVKFKVIGGAYLEKDKLYEKDVIDYVKKHDKNNIVEFVGPVPHEDIPQYLAKANLVVNASQTYGVDKAVLEALVAGVPVVTSNIAFRNMLPEACRFEENDTDDFVNKVLNINSAPIGQLQKQVIENHSLHNTIKNILSYVS